MAYTDIESVQARMTQFILRSDSNPSLSTAEVLLAESEAQVDASLENLGYVVPITGEKSQAIVRGMVIALTIARILDARAAAVGSEAAMKSAERAQKFYDDRMAALMDENNPLELSDSVRTESQTVKPAMLISGLLYDENGDDIEPHVTMDMIF